MMKPLRLATNEEVEKIKADADVDVGCSVIALDDNFAVLRACHEIDPFIMAENVTDRQKAAFIWGIENCLRFTGVPFYYFNVPVSDEKYIEVVKSWGAQQTSREPEFRFKKLL